MWNKDHKRRVGKAGIEMTRNLDWVVVDQKNRTFVRRDDPILETETYLADLRIFALGLDPVWTNSLTNAYTWHYKRHAPANLGVVIRYADAVRLVARWKTEPQASVVSIENEKNMDITFHNVLITISAKSPVAAYNKLCKLLQDKDVEYTTDIYSVNVPNSPGSPSGENPTSDLLDGL
jgi:hypothetical protein